MSDNRPSTDLVMKFMQGKRPVLAECTLQIATDDSMMKDFESAKSLDDYSNFFEVLSFDLGLGVKEDDKEQSNGQAGSGPFARWRNALDDSWKKIRYPVEMEQFTFERLIDRSSLNFFESCCHSKPFDSATLVKRVGRGGLALPAGYLRIDFDDVLVTGVEWGDGEVVKEKCTFICSAMKFRYRRRSHDGTVQQTESAAQWSRSV